MKRKLSNCYNERSKISSEYKQQRPLISNNIGRPLYWGWERSLVNKYGRRLYRDVTDYVEVDDTDIMSLHFFKIYNDLQYHGLPFWWPGPLSKIFDEHGIDEDSEYYSEEYNNE